MGKGTLTVYNASAGSGKTYTLTAIYLSSLFESRYNYRKILAVTFTNKATAEMKSRILDSLHKLASGESCEYLEALVKEKRKPEEWIRSEAKEILNSILHDYSRFSVSTIDSFFQKVLRAFAREAGLHSGFNVELDHNVLLSSAVDDMISSASDNAQLRNWLISYALANIDEEKSWNLKEGIIKLAHELFKEEFKILSIDERAKLQDKKFLGDFIVKLKSISTSFEKDMMMYGTKATEFFAAYDLTDDMFYRKGQGIPGYVRALMKGNINEPNRYVQEILSDTPRWATSLVTLQLQAALAAGLDSTLTEALRFYYANFVAYTTSRVMLSNIYALGILSDVLQNIHRITTTENRFLLSDAGELLNLITRGDQCPFIYEKIGNRFENFMIDEFQDTSLIQWNNFRPLIDNSMAQGYDNLVVGDIKQSIYRWRNSDWRILGSILDYKDDKERFISLPLSTNWRSRSNVIRFNNTLFTVIPEMLDKTLEEDLLPESFSKLYCQAIQVDPGKKPGGYVRLEFLENEAEKSWQDKAMELLPGVLESFQDKGYEASDIGIIVRDGKEGACVLKTLIDYSNNCPSGNKLIYNYNVVSNDSLLLSNSPVVNFIISVISAVNDPSDMISRAAMLRFWLLSKGSSDADKAPLNVNSSAWDPDKFFPAGHKDLIDGLKHVPLFEAVEHIISFFELGDFSWNVPYLNTFQDFVLNFTGSNNSDIRSFLDWWETSGSNKSVVLPGNQDAARILTIHKSKGLEFKVVILPFLAWNMDHTPSKQPLLWAKPSIAPFNEIGIVPVKCSKELMDTIFADYYKKEKHSVYLDNLNLLYVALTRAKDAIYGFSVNNPRQKSAIAGVLKEAMLFNPENTNDVFSLNSRYNAESAVFEFGEVPQNIRSGKTGIEISSPGYKVSEAFESLKLKLHGENYFSSDDVALRKKINYGKLMHEIFEGISTPADISFSVRKLVLEGKLPEDEAPDIEIKVRSLISNPSVAEWFSSENKVLKEAGILLTSGNIRRPDRVIFRNGRTTVIDFKFGEENSKFIEQVGLYRSLLLDMGYADVDGFIWYVEKNKIVSA